MVVRDIGIPVTPPNEKCNDSKCPFHSGLKLRGRVFTCEVVSAKMQKSAVVKWARPYFLAKYGLYEKRKTKLSVHNPPCINAKEGDTVKIMECRPLSKTVNFVIVEKENKK